MFDFLYMGSPLFMGILTLLLLVVIMLTVQSFMKKGEDLAINIKNTDLIKSVGLLSLVVGMLGFLIGMYSAMTAIETTGGIAPGVLAGGLKVGLIAPTYGLIIYGISHVASIFLRR